MNRPLTDALHPDARTALDDLHRIYGNPIGRIEWRIIPAGHDGIATMFCHRPGLATVTLQIHPDRLAAGGWNYLGQLAQACQEAGVFRGRGDATDSTHPPGCSQPVGRSSTNKMEESLP
jgi:hypothetical protein